MILQNLKAPSHNLVFKEVWANVRDLYHIKIYPHSQKYASLAEELQEYASELNNIPRGLRDP